MEKRRDMRTFAPAVLVIFALALTLRIIHIWQMRSSPFFSVLIGDARGYDQWAQRIAGGDWVGRDVFYQAPLYPYFLAFIYWRSEERRVGKECRSRWSQNLE